MKVVLLDFETLLASRIRCIKARFIFFLSKLNGVVGEYRFETLLPEQKEKEYFHPL